MKIGLVDIDGHAKKKKWGATIYPNLALCKIARWHKEQGDEVEWASPMFHYDVVYMSKVFNFSPDDTTIYDADRIIKGGTGYDIMSKLPDEIDRLQPDYIQIENVEEFMCWGELDEHGKPISKRKGIDYMRWVMHVCDYGYDFGWRILNAADFGAYTSRKRYFGQFARKGLPIAFPQQTHAKNGDEGGMFKMYKKWRPVREVLDLDDDGESIFTRKKPLCEKTLERIYAGLVKFVAGGKKQHEQFMMRYNTVRAQDTVKSIEEPCGVVTTENRFAKVKCQFLSKQFSGDPSGKNIDIDQPAGTVTCKDHHAFVAAYYGNGFNTSIDDPAPTVTTKEGVVGIAIYDDDSPWTRKVKEFMAAYGIVDICMRMLNIGELKRIMGFPTDYTLVGTQAEQKKFIGNAVEVNMSRVLCEALSERLRQIA